MSDKSKRAMAYIRVSTVRQVEEGNSIGSQTLSVTEYAKSKGLILRSRDIIIDDGTSGGIPIWDRPNGKKILKMADSGKFRHIIVTKLDRMFRLTSDAILSIDELEERGIALHVIDLGGQSMDTSSAMGQFIMRFVASIAELERGLISERTKEAMQYLRKKGKKYTRAIYGWDVNGKGILIPNWVEQSRIDFMCWQMQMNEVSATRVAKMMNKRNWNGKLGGLWTAQTVLKVTQNKIHLKRHRFKFPDWWGDKTWHRKVPDRKQRDEKVVVKPVTEEWTKEDLKDK